MKLHERLKYLRLKNNLTQDEVAEKLHITRQSISKWEQGTNEPSIDSLKSLALIYGVSISEIIDDNHITNRPNHKKMFAEQVLFYVNTAVFILLILVSFIFIRGLKDHVPMHFDIKGNITRYGSKWEMLIFILLGFVFYVVSLVIHFVYKKKEPRYLTTWIVNHAFTIFAQLIVLVIFIILSSNQLKDSNNSLPLIAGFTFSILIIAGIFTLPYFNSNPNPFYGFRTFFSRTNKEIWIKINRFQSMSIIIITSLSYILTFIFFQEWCFYLIFGIVASLIPSFIYHEILRYQFNKENKKSL